MNQQNKNKLIDREDILRVTEEINQMRKGLRITNC